MTRQLSLGLESPYDAREIAPGAWHLRGFARDVAETLRSALAELVAAAPFRHMHTPGGLVMGVALSNSGEWGWVSDRAGYRYVREDPLSGERWPALPEGFRELAHSAADRAGYPGFMPDACLINRYAPGTRLGLHQDKDEHDFGAPIVSVSLGLPAVFLFGGLTRGDATQRIALEHGDVVVWGGPARLRYHGVLPVADGVHASFGAQRINLTFRRAR